METYYKKLTESQITISELMLPSHTNFSGKIHGGYILRLMDQIAFASASKYSGKYCVTASVDKVDFLNPIEVGELVTLKASVNYVGNSSMVVGMRVEAENIQTGAVKHCNSSYFTMVAKNDVGVGVTVPRPIITSLKEARRFHNAIKRIDSKKKHYQIKEEFDHTTPEAFKKLEKFDVKIKF
ncbi:acyl-CoA thioesterase [Flavobacterium litorale]|uniref:Acyl-CoA thioesterase n=1 Tax=Flavobacterium litorale TaxID=2856519 RepID=A0ABX8V6S5_9FLAO|nr:acyl-CoA thioesterase [Flavobacterium litorale]QYJ68192.1 acyl-CoA thioesterase [Flavobacterium litorale]